MPIRKPYKDENPQEKQIFYRHNFKSHSAGKKQAAAPLPSKSNLVCSCALRGQTEKHFLVPWFWLRQKLELWAVFQTRNTIPVVKYGRASKKNPNQNCSAVISQSWHPGNVMKEMKPGVTHSPSLCYICRSKNTAALQIDQRWQTLTGTHIDMPGIVKQKIL